MFRLLNLTFFQINELNQAFTSYFGGEDPSQKLEAVKTDLDNAGADQETTRKALPEETARIYYLSGQILEMIEDMNRVGKIAYDGQSEMIGQLNKDILLRGGKGGPKNPPPDTTSGDNATSDNAANTPTS